MYYTHTYLWDALCQALSKVIFISATQFSYRLSTNHRARCTVTTHTHAHTHTQPVSLSSSLPLPLPLPPSVIFINICFSSFICLYVCLSVCLFLCSLFFPFIRSFTISFSYRIEHAEAACTGRAGSRRPIKRPFTVKNSGLR